MMLDRTSNYAAIAVCVLALCFGWGTAFASSKKFMEHTKIFAENTCGNVYMRLRGPREIDLYHKSSENSDFTLFVSVSDTDNIDEIAVVFPQIVQNVESMERTEVGVPDGIRGHDKDGKYVWIHPPLRHMRPNPPPAHTERRVFKITDKSKKDIQINLPAKNLLARYANPVRFPTGHYTITDFPFRVYAGAKLLCEIKSADGFSFEIINKP